MKTTVKFTGICVIASLALLLFIGSGYRSTTSPVAATEPELLKLSGDLGVHDPVIIREKDSYYIFCTSGGRRGGIIPVRCSTNLLNWMTLTNGSITDSPFSFSDPAATNYPRRYYRLTAP